MNNTKDTWKEEFEELMTEYTIGPDWNIVDGYIPLEDFIQTLLSQREESVREEERRFICQLQHNMMLPEINEDTQPEWKKKLQYNQALQNSIREIQALSDTQVSK